MICRMCGGPTVVLTSRYPEVNGKLNKRAKRRQRACADPACAFKEMTLEVPEHRVVLEVTKTSRPRVRIGQTSRGPAR